jgi:hypothetical protein
MAIEIEFRGPLTKEEYNKLFAFLKKNGQFKKKWTRETYVFFTEDKSLDLKVRTTDGATEIVIKKGKWGASQREEIILPVDSASVEIAKKFLAALGYNEGIIAVRETNIFLYQEVEFAVVKSPDGLFFYEAEYVGEPVKNPEKQILKVLRSLNLNVWSEKEVVDFFLACRKTDRHFKID